VDLDVWPSDVYCAWVRWVDLKWIRGTSVLQNRSQGLLKRLMGAMYIVWKSLVVNQVTQGPLRAYAVYV
jgi:hypothetical protein